MRTPKKPSGLPILCVEGQDDLAVINALLAVHGVNTQRGQRHLYIKDEEGVTNLLDNMFTRLKENVDAPRGFVFDIDTKVAERWQAVCDRLTRAMAAPEYASFPALPTFPSTMPPEGYCCDEYLGQPFGIYLMPDCISDGQKLEDLVATLVLPAHPIWLHAESATDEARRIGEQAKVSTFKREDAVKAQVRAFLAWQQEPGNNMGQAILKGVIGHESEPVLRFLRWLHRLYPRLPLDIPQ